MSTSQVILVILTALIFIALYTFLSFYVGNKGFHALSKVITRKKVYWIIFWCVSFSYIIGFLVRRTAPAYSSYTTPFNIVGTYWMVALFYFILIFPLVDLTRFFIKRLGLHNRNLYNKLKMLYANGLLVIFLVILLIGYGVINASKPVVSNYDITVNKSAKELSSLNIAMVSDLHLGIGITKEDLDDMVKEINSLSPDIIFLSGDIVDENTSWELIDYMSTAFSNLSSKYGSYAITGNHEFSAGDFDMIEKNLTDGGITLLRDKAVKIEDSFYVIGRDDTSVKRYSDSERKAIASIDKSIDKSLPIIVLDHQPSNLGEPSNFGADLQFSGHTHKGQFFPNNLITKRIFESDYGYYKKDNMQLIVSSGFGTWGSPIRIGTKSEIVHVNLIFNKE